MQPRQEPFKRLIPTAAKFSVGQGSSDLQTQHSFSAAIMGRGGGGGRQEKQVM